jgi:hypothetical protein
VGSAELSPFIVKLSRSDEAPLLQAITPEEDPIAALAKSFIIEHDEVSDGQFITTETEDDLLLSIEDLRAQLLEGEQELDAVEPQAQAALPALRSLDDALPIDIWSDVQPVDVVQVFAQPEAVLDVASAPEPIDTLAVVPGLKTRTIFFKTPHGWQRALASFVGLALATVMPLHALQVLADARADGGFVPRIFW